MDKTRQAASTILTEVIHSIDPGKTPQERTQETIKDAQHKLTALLSEKDISPELERDLISAISKLINIRHNLTKFTNFRPCKF